MKKNEKKKKITRSLTWFSPAEGKSAARNTNKSCYTPLVSRHFHIYTGVIYRFHGGIYSFEREKIIHHVRAGSKRARSAAPLTRSSGLKRGRSRRRRVASIVGLRRAFRARARPTFRSRLLLDHVVDYCKSFLSCRSARLVSRCNL